MKLHKNPKLFEQSINITSEKLKIPAVYIEKDYWVTLALFELFNSDFKHELVFKGGTALSKGYSIIERFSEDIDLVIIRDNTETENQLKKQIGKISKYFKIKLGILMTLIKY